MSVLTLKVDEVMRTLSAESANPFVVHDKEVDIVRFAINSGFADIVLDGQVALRVMYQRPGESQVRAQTLTYYDTDGLRNYYDWQLLSTDLTKKGTLTVALCILRTDSEVEEWHTTPCQIRVLDTIHTDDSDEADETITPTVAQRVAVLETMIQRVASGAPIVVASTSAMTDTEQIYVLSANGNWYYHNGTTWVSGGTYGAVATDTTLTQSGIPADAKVTGDKIDEKITMPSGGTEGQLLQYNGNGNTTWTSFGMPTDAQVETIFSDWLDDHPEATTTVEDFSLTVNKLVKGTLGFVTPDMFGAVGDGVTDDTTAVRNAITYSIANNCAVFIPQKTYAITHESNTINLIDNQSVIIYGAGENSIIKRKDDSLVSKWNRLFVFCVGACVSTHANDVILSNFCIDSNRRNQSNATDGYEFEAAGDVVILNGSGLTDPSYQYIDRVIIDNMRFYDPVADCFNFSGSTQTYVKNVWINRMVASDRQGTRNDIGFTCNPLGDVWIQNCSVGSIHFEYNQTVAEENIITYHFDSVTTKSLSLGGKFDAILTNVHSNELLLTGYRRILAVGCIFDLTSSYNYMYNKNNPDNKLDIVGCYFVNRYNYEGITAGLYFRIGTNVNMIGCGFGVLGDNDLDMDGDGTNDHVSFRGFAIERGSNVKAVVDSCSFSQKHLSVVEIPNGCSVTLKNMVIDTGEAFSFGVLNPPGSYTDIYLDLFNIHLGENCVKSFAVNTFSGNPVFKFNGDMNCKESNFPCTFATTTANNNFNNSLSGTFKRKLKLSAPLDFTLLKSIFKYTDTARHNYYFIKGDEFEYTDEATPQKWTAKKTDTTTANSVTGMTGTQIPLSKRFKTYGSATGDTASRPTCILDSGFVYFDTDLGKPIFWNGTGWVDSTGTAVS